MSKVHDYLEAAKGAIVSGACDKAIASCHYVLQQYPKHLEAHCLLAEAYREQGNVQAAEELFLCVLSADPESLIARWALSILHEARGEREEALGHLRIAMEVNPDHSELRKELIGLGGDRVKPTRGGLARLYVRGGHFDRAVEEFRAALAREPQRLDLLVGLAEAHWRARRNDEAARLCRRVLDVSPDCLKALLIAAFVEAAQGKPLGDGEAALWQAAASLDPEGRIGRALLESVGMPIPPDRQALLADRAATAEAGRGTGDQEDAPGGQPEQLRGDRLHTAGGAPPIVAAGAPAPGAQIAAKIDCAAGVAVDEVHRAEREQSVVAPVAGSVCGAADSGGAAEARSETVARAPSRTGPAGRLTMYGGGSNDAEQALRPPETMSDAPRREDASEPTDWDEWGDLLREEITLDPDAEARLAAALAEVRAADGGVASGPPGVPTRGQNNGVGERPAADAVVPAGPRLGESPLEPKERLALARTRQQANDLEGAVTEYRAALTGAPDLANAVAEGLRELVRLRPDHVLAHRTLGDAHMKSGRFQQAIEAYNQALTLEKESN